MFLPQLFKNVKDYIGCTWLTRYHKDFEKGYQFAVLDLLWMNEENEKRLAEKNVPTDPAIQETDFGKHVDWSVEQYLSSLKGEQQL